MRVLEGGLANGSSVAVGSTLLRVNTVPGRLWRTGTKQGWPDFVEGLEEQVGERTETVEELIDLGCRRKTKWLSKKELECPVDQAPKVASMNDGATGMAHKA